MKNKGNKSCTPKPTQVTPGAWTRTSLKKGMK